MAVKRVTTYTVAIELIGKDTPITITGDEAKAAIEDIRAEHAVSATVDDAKAIIPYHSILVATISSTSQESEVSDAFCVSAGDESDAPGTSFPSTPGGGEASAT